MMQKAVAGLGALALLALGGPSLLTPRAPQASPGEGVVTLYARDDLVSSLDFEGGGAGARLVAGQVDLSAAELAYGVFAEDMLSVGFDRNRLARIVDLGDEPVPSLSLATDETLRFPVSRFHSLRLERGAFYFDDALGKRVREKEAGRVLGPMSDEGLVHVAPALGHVYVLRLRGRQGDRDDVLYKFQVIDHEPRRRLTLRWSLVPVD